MPRSRRIVREEHQNLVLIHEGMDDTTTFFTGYRGVDLDNGFVTPEAVSNPPT
jgi:hypothetical protein